MGGTIMGKLDLDWGLVKEARESAKKIAADSQVFIDAHSTVTVERTICRLLGIDGVDEFGVPLPNVVVDFIKDNGNISLGVAKYIGNAMIETGLQPQEIAEKIAKKELDITKMQWHDDFDIQLALKDITPYIYVIVATGNIYEDVTQAVAAARQGADVVAVIRTTGQSLLDFVPYGATTEGFGGTMATQENFRIMRKALDDVGVELGRYIRLCNYCSGLCMPEIAAMGALERLDMMLNDALYGILFRDINMKRTLVDQFFSRIINGFAGVIINTGEDNYLTTADAIEEAHTVLASQFINEQFALIAGLPEEQMGLGHAFEMEPGTENGFLLELAQAQMAREIFPKAPLKYMPPTKFMTGNIFKGHIQDALFNIVTITTGQKVHLLGMLTEAIHTPFMSDRALSIENAKYIFNNLKDFGNDIEFKKGGIMNTRAQEVLKKAADLLKTIETMGIFKTIEKGVFGGVRRPIDGGKGLAGVFEKDSTYFNPFIPLMLGGDR